MDHVLGPVDELAVNLKRPAYVMSQAFTMSQDQFRGTAHLLESLCIVVAEADLLPHVFRAVGSFDGLDVEEKGAFVLSNGSIARVGQRAAVAVTEATVVVHISTESVPR